MSDLTHLVPTLVALGLLMALTVVVLRGTGVPQHLAPSKAILRGALQLALISLVLGRLIVSPFWIAVALLVMFSVAAVTASRRLGWSWWHLAVVAGSMAAGIGVTLLVVFGTGAIDLTPRYALAISGIVIGNAMSTATLTGRRFLESAGERWGEVEAWLSMGASRRLATLDLARLAVHSALIPATDQTRTTGLVTLPGAFVGAIFGGISPLEAGRFQVVVLASIMAAGSVTATLVAHALAPLESRPAPLS